MIWDSYVIEVFSYKRKQTQSINICTYLYKDIESVHKLSKYQAPNIPHPQSCLHPELE